MTDLLGAVLFVSSVLFLVLGGPAFAATMLVKLLSVAMGRP